MVTRLSRIFFVSSLILSLAASNLSLAASSLAPGLAPVQALSGDAEDLYRRRGEGRNTVHLALAEYRKLLKGASGQDLIHIVHRISSLNIFEGEFLLLDSNHSERNPIFGECREVIEHLAEISEATDIYHYMKLMCSALWVESATPLQLVGVGSYFKNYFNTFVTSDMNLRPDLGADPRIKGGGIFRTIAGIAASPMSNMVHPALPSLDKAMEMINLALASPSHPANEYTGADMYSNHRAKAEILIRMNRIPEGRALLEDSIAAIEELAEDGDLPPGIEAETLAEINKMREILGRL